MIEVTIEYLIPLYIRNEGDGPRIAKVIVDDEADLSAPSATAPSARRR
jgi:hypothetical protein